MIEPETMREAVAIVTAFDVDKDVMKDLIVEVVEDAIQSRDAGHLSQLIGALGLMAYGCIQVYAEQNGITAQSVRQHIIAAYMRGDS